MCNSAILPISWNVKHALTVLFAPLILFASEHPTPTVPADRALQMLVEGNQRYVTNRLSHPDQTAARRTLVAAAQHPFAVILGCADSRVPPEVIFDQGLGDIFVVRVAGNVTSAEVLGSVEYAIEHLDTSLVVVLGHEKCGAVQAAASGGRAEGHIAALMHDIEPAVKEARSQKGDLVHNAVICNVKNSVHAIATALPDIKKRIAQGRLKVVGADYDLQSGRVEFLEKLPALVSRAH